jgi:hypothetical protein
MAKRVILKVLSAIAGIAGVVSFLMPVSTSTQWFLCIGSFAIAFICFAVLNAMDDKNPGSWPAGDKSGATPTETSSAPDDPLKR